MSDLWELKAAKATIVWKDYAEVKQVVMAATSENELIAIVERVEELFAKDVSPLIMKDDDWHSLTRDLTAKVDEFREAQSSKM